jgi:hypothetical protein
VIKLTIGGIVNPRSSREGLSRRFDPGGVFLTILNMGELKDAIDRRFMRKFQVSGEQREFPRQG